MAVGSTGIRARIGTSAGRKALLLFGLAAALALRLVAPSPQEEPTVGPTRRLAPAASGSTPASAAAKSVEPAAPAGSPGRTGDERPVAPVASLRFRQVIDEGGIDMFSAPPLAAVAAAAPPSTVPPARVRSAPAVAPPPMQIAPVAADVRPPVVAVPVFPYRVLGRYDVDGATLVFLEGARGTEAVAVGQLLEGIWRIDSIGAQQMTVRYAPTNHLASISIAMGKSFP